jgi:hypothetical protein
MNEISGGSDYILGILSILGKFLSRSHETSSEFATQNSIKRER